MLLKPNILDKKAFEIVSIHINTIVKDFLEAFLDEYISYGFDEDDVDYISEVFPCNSDIKDKRAFLKGIAKECGNLDNFSHFSYFNILRMGDESERNYVLDVLRHQAHKISEEKGLDEEKILTNLMRNIEDISMYPIAYFDEYEFMELEED